MGETRSRRALLKAAVGVAATPFAQRLHAASLERTTYVQRVSTDRATIVWTTRDPGSPSLQLADNPGFARAFTVQGRTRSFAAAATSRGFDFQQHAIEVTGLAPGTRYFYRPLLNGENLLVSGLREPSFSTAPASGDFRFLVIGDSGTGLEPQLNIRTRMLQETTASLVVHTGDVVYPHASYTFYDTNYFEIYRDMMRQMPFYPCLGNHDIDNDLGQSYRDVHVLPTDGVPDGDRHHYYSTDWGDVHFAMLDSNWFFDPAWMARQTAFLERDLAQTTKKWKIVVWHHTPYDGRRGGDREPAAARERIIPILERYGVQLVLCGHNHLYERTHRLLGGERTTDPRGIFYVTTGGGGAGLHDGSPHPAVAFSRTVHHFLTVDVTDTRLTVRAVDAQGRVFDTLTVAAPTRIAATLVNAASGVPRVAPGSIVSLFGSNLAFSTRSATGALGTQLDDVRVTLGDRDLPLFYVSPTQINAQTPFSILGDQVVRQLPLRVTNSAGAVLAASDATVAETAPGIFGSPANPAIVNAQNAWVNAGSPIEPGGVIVIYATGLGLVNGGAASGEITPREPLKPALARVRVLIGDAEIAPAFAGLTPGQIGLYQVNVQLPASLAAGEHSLRISAGDAVSNAVTLFVREPA